MNVCEPVRRSRMTSARRAKTIGAGTADAQVLAVVSSKLEQFYIAAWVTPSVNRRAYVVRSQPVRPYGETLSKVRSWTRRTNSPSSL
jgi:hypothetical protein